MLTLVGLLGLSQLLGMPLWCAVFALCAFLAPTPQSRHKLLVTVGIELAIGACALVNWFAPHPSL